MFDISNVVDYWFELNDELPSTNEWLNMMDRVHDGCIPTTFDFALFFDDAEIQTDPEGMRSYFACHYDAFCQIQAIAQDGSSRHTIIPLYNLNELLISGVYAGDDTVEIRVSIYHTSMTPMGIPVYQKTSSRYYRREASGWYWGTI